MKNTVPPPTLGGQGFTGAEPPTAHGATLSFYIHIVIFMYRKRRFRINVFFSSYPTHPRVVGGQAPLGAGNLGGAP